MADASESGRNTSGSPNPSCCLEKEPLSTGGWFPLVLPSATLLVLAPTSPRASRVAPRPHTHIHPVFSLPLSLSYLGSLRQQRAVNHQAFFSSLCLISLWYIWREGSLLRRGNHSARRHLPPLPLHSSLKLQNQGTVYLEGLGAFPYTVTMG